MSEYPGEWEQFKTDKPELHPNPEGNGDATLDFFSEEFDFSARETAAILGAHTLGWFLIRILQTAMVLMSAVVRMHPQVSLFKYTWTTAATESFNNHYFKNIVREDRYAFTDMTGKCYRSGLQDNVKPKTRWLARVRWETKNGGPVHWIHENYRK